MTRFAMCLQAVCLLVLGGACLADTPAKKPPPTTQPSAAQQALERMSLLMRLPRVKTRADWEAEVRKRAPLVLKALAEMEKQHPDSGELHAGRMLALSAAYGLSRLNKDPLMAKRAEALARKMMGSTAPGAMKLDADFFLVLIRLVPMGATSTAPAEDNAAAIRQFIRRYENDELSSRGWVKGMELAAAIRDRELHQQLQEEFVRKHPDSPVTRQILRRQGKHPDVGKPFIAELTRLDGGKLKLPDDLRGKVFVVDFWAVWCGPCVREIPHMKALYAKYKPRGVEFVGISLDRSRQALEQFIKDRQMGWVHTFSGLGWKDPTVGQYGVRGIPSIWVVGRDGKIVSDDARSDLGATIEEALSAKPPAAGKGGT